MTAPREPAPGGGAATSGAPTFGAPPARTPLAARDVPALRGKRVVLSTALGFVYDMRAAGEVLNDDDGRAVVDVVSEEDWYRWMLLGTAPHVERWAADRVWVE